MLLINLQIKIFYCFIRMKKIDKFQKKSISLPVLKHKYSASKDLLYTGYGSILINPVSLNLFRSGSVAVHDFIYWYRLDSNLYEFEETRLIKMDPYSVWSRSLLAEYLCFSSGKVIDFFWSLSIFFILMYFLISYGCINAGTLCFRDDSSWSHRPFRTGTHCFGTYGYPHQT